LPVEEAHRAADRAGGGANSPSVTVMKEHLEPKKVQKKLSFKVVKKEDSKVTVVPEKPEILTTIRVNEKEGDSLLVSGEPVKAKVDKHRKAEL
jgi:hypothetical protein